MHKKIITLFFFIILFFNCRAFSQNQTEADKKAAPESSSADLSTQEQPSLAETVNETKEQTAAPELKTAQEAVTNISSQDKTDITEQTNAPQARAQEKLVTAIEIKGNKHISSNTILSKMKTRTGDPYQENVISDDLKRLYLLGFFSDIKIDTEDYHKGIKVVIKVVERPIIEKIVFSGIRRLTMREDKIKESLKSKESQYLDYPSLDEDARILKKIYEKIGYGGAQIEYKVDVNKETDKAKIEFNISEGKRVRIKNISVKGNKSFSEKRILRLMKTKRGWLFNAGVLKDEVLKEDIERIKSFYRREGFADVAVDYNTASHPKKAFLYINITIREGKKYLTGNVSIQGNKDISTKDVLAKLKECIPGKVFSQEALKQDIANIQSLYFDRGYIFAQVQEATSMNSYTGRIDVVYNITENDVAYVDKIKIRGNIKTKDVVIRRELRIKPGDRFDGQKLKRSKERLQNLGYFEEIDYDTAESSAGPDKRDLIVDVKEAKTGSFSFGGGYSSVDAFVGFAEIEQKNFDWKNFPYFTGAGQDLKLRGSFGTLSNDLDLSFTDPWVFDYPVSFGFDGYKHTHKRESSVGYGYDESVTGGDLRLGKEFLEYLRGDLTYRYDTIRITNIADNATNDLTKESGTNAISSMEFALTYDSRDNVFDTTKGNILTNSVQVAGGPFGGDKDFMKYFTRASHYLGLFRGSVLEFRGRIGLAWVYGDSDSVPIYDRYFAGGAYTIRGYDERKVGPIDPVTKDPLGGNSMFVGNIEYTYPLFSFLRLAAFYDAGNVWDKIKNTGKGGLKSGTGLGVRIKTPIGPIMLDYGIPMNKAPGEDSRKSGRVHFSMSHGF